MPTFDFVVVGSGGGPSELDVSAYLLKARDSSWKDGIIGVEAGSGLGALKRILELKPDLFRDSGSGTDMVTYSAAQVYSFVRAFLVSHAHLDHIMGLVLLAGAVDGPRKSIRGSLQVLKDLEDSIFGPSRVWPNLASWKKDDLHTMYLYDALDFNAGYSRIHGNISIRMMPLSHGSHPAPYQSSAFFIRHDPSSQEFLFFGDVEPDSVATNPQTIHVWRAAAAKIPHQLKTIFIECSWPSGRDDSLLYGHLTPEHLVQELEVLAGEVLKSKARSSTKAKAPALPSSGSASPARKRQKTESPSTDELRGVLAGVQIYIIHFKEDMKRTFDQPMSVVITKQIRDLVEVKGLGAEIIAAVQGAHIEI